MSTRYFLVGFNVIMASCFLVQEGKERFYIKPLICGLGFLLQVKIYILFSIPWELWTPQECSCRSLTIGGHGARIGVTGPAGDQTCYPEHREASRCFTGLLLSVLKLGYCQWNWLVANATVAFDLSLMEPVRPTDPMKIHKI